MFLEQKIKQIIKKVRDMYKYDLNLKDILKMDAVIKLDETCGEIILSSISFNYYDKLLVSTDGIYFIPEHGHGYHLIKYNNFDELLEL